MSGNHNVRVFVLDDDSIHIDAFAALFSQAERVDFIVCESVEELRQQSEGIDLIMINMECRKWCPDLFLFRILNEIKSITVMCYSTGGWVSQSILDEHRDRLLRLCYTEVIDSLRRCMASIQRGDALNTTWFMDVSNSLEGSPMVELECLSPRELDILCLVGKGHGTPEMAEILKCCPSTVETHITNIRGKLRLSGIIALRYLAIQYARTGCCRTFSKSENHICPDRGRSVGTCPLRGA